MMMMMIMIDFNLVMEPPEVTAGDV